MRKTRLEIMDEREAQRLQQYEAEVDRVLKLKREEWARQMEFVNKVLGVIVGLLLVLILLGAIAMILLIATEGPIR